MDHAGPAGATCGVGSQRRAVLASRQHPIDDSPVDPATIRIASFAATNPMCPAAGSDMHLGRGRKTSALECRHWNDWVAGSGDDQRRDADLVQDRTTAGPRMVIMYVGEASQGGCEHAVEVQQAGRERLERPGQCVGNRALRTAICRTKDAQIADRKSY